MRTSFDQNSIIRVVGIVFLVIAAAMFLPIAVAFYYREALEARSFIAVSFACTVVGFFILRLFTGPGLKLKQREGYFIVSVVWVLAPVLAALPLILCGAVTNPADAFFEMCSGFSTTGATILTDVEAQAHAVLIWRSFTHWLGGMGIVVFATAMLPSLGLGGQLIAGAESPGPTLSKISAHFSDTAKKLYLLYFFFTIAEMILLLLGGMNLFDSAIHTFGSVGTGGFSNYNASVGHFASPYLQWVIIIFMFLCGVNFNLYFLILRRKIKSFFKDEELRLYTVIIVTSSLLITGVLLVQGGYDSLSKAVRDAFFQVTSIITTTGYMTTDFNLWPSFCKFLLVIVMITGACSSSTGGGVKIVRVLMSIKFVRRGFFMKLHPNRVINLTLNSKAMPQGVVSNIVNFVFLYIATLFVGMLLISVDGFDMVTNFTASLTCISNVGPGLNEVGPASNFANFSDFSTVVLSVLMIAGRLELFTFFMMFSPRFWNSNKA